MGINYLVALILSAHINKYKQIICNQTMGDTLSLWPGCYRVYVS